MSQNGHHYHAFNHSTDDQPDDEGDDLGSLTDELDHRILMHRDAHFGGDFGVMLNYYNNEDHIGIEPDFDTDRIAYLAEIEKEIGQDLAALILSGPEAEAVAAARKAYTQLKQIYQEEETKQNLQARLIADLILTEEEEPEQEIESVVAQSQTIVPHLLSLIGSDDMYDPLFPGYGCAPFLAILALGYIQDSRAIVPLFETLSKPIVFDEMVVVEALANLGRPAKEFLLKVVKSRPLTQDNINAAFALMAFHDEPEVALCCFEQLQDPAVQDKPLLCSYLVSNCDMLTSTPSKNAFIEMGKDPNLPTHLRSEIAALVKNW